MKAQYLGGAGRLVIHHNGAKIAEGAIRPEDPRELVTRANAALASCTVTGHTVADWIARRHMAEALIEELTA